MSLDAMAEEIQNQIEDLPKLALEFRKDGRRLNPTEAIFTGSGDSYAASLFAREVSGGVAGVEDPYELLTHPARARRKVVVVISVSGRTRTNVLLARRLARVAKKTIAVTSKADSPLARNCSETLLLRYRRAERLTAGTVSFTSSLLACVSLMGRAPKVPPLQGALEVARQWAQGVKLSRNGSFLFVGADLGHALAEYGACKIQEVLGARADAVYSEQLGHAQLFSVQPRKDVIVTIAPSGDRKTKAVARSLSENGFTVHAVDGSSTNPVIWSIEVSFHLQMLAYNLARRIRMKECAFVSARDKLALSSSLIYRLDRCCLVQ